MQADLQGTQIQSGLEQGKIFLQKNKNKAPYSEYSLANIPVFPAVHSSALQEESQLQSRIHSARSSGHHLDKQTQQQLEQGLGTTLSSVRVHTDKEADHLSRAVNAIAFTTGPDIFFRSGMYRPGSLQGLHLLAHEATHVVQQATDQLPGISHLGGISISEPGDRLEQAAEASAAQITANITLQRHATSRSNGHDLNIQRGAGNPKGPSVQQHSALIHRSISSPARNLVLQRRVGFEFENREIKLIRTDLKQYEKDLESFKNKTINTYYWNKKYKELYPKPKEAILKENYFTLEADDTMGDADVEFVVHGSRPGKTGFGFDQKEEMSKTVEKVQGLAQKIKQKKGNPFEAKELDPKAEEGIVIHEKKEEAYIFQATAGIRLDKLTSVMRAPTNLGMGEHGGNAEDVVNDTKKAIQENLAEYGLKTNRLNNLLSLIALYIRGVGTEGKFMKNMTPLMSRTDFATLFTLLPSMTRTFLQENPAIWKKLVLQASDKVLSRPFRDVDLLEWAEKMMYGRDLLKEADPNKAMGALEGRMDTGNPADRPKDSQHGKATKKQPIFEFRRLPGVLPDDFLKRSLDFFNYIEMLNNEKERSDPNAN